MNGVLSLALGLAISALAPGATAAEPRSAPAKASSGPGESHDPDNVTAISQFMETIAKANALYVAKDTTSAIDAYKKAIQLAPRNALGHTMLAEAYLGSGNLGEADAAIQQAIEVTSAKDPLRARALLLRAEVLERRRKHEDAKAAWQALAEQASKLADPGALAQTAAERIKAMQRVIDLEARYAAVRERIAAEKTSKGAKK